jgi:hypothetical protein
MPKTVFNHNLKRGKKTGKKYSSVDSGTKIKSAAELGLKAESLGIAKKTKSHKGRKILEDRQAKSIEN